MTSRKRSTGATIRAVAQHAQVSAMTVSRVVNGSLSVHPDTRARIMNAIAELHYVAKPHRREHIEQPRHTIGLIVPNLGDPFFTKIGLGVELAASRHGYGVIMCNSHGDSAYERHYLQDLIARRVDGIIMAAFNDYSAATLHEFMHHGYPLVLIDREIPGIYADVVQSDGMHGMVTLMQHLIALGHRRIAFISSDYHISTSRDRLHGYRLALDTAGIMYDSTLVYEEIPSDAPPGYRSALGILQQSPPPHAIVTVNAVTAAGVVQACNELRLRIPHDIALVTFDEFDHTSTIFPFFTVAEQATTLMGASAVERLLIRIREPQAPVVNIKLPTVFIERRSCGSQRLIDFFETQFALR